MKKSKITIHIAGDSTAANYPVEQFPMAGWGQVLEQFLSKNFLINNAAICGRSSKNFIEEGHLEKLEKVLQPGDYFFIQFGHNDEKSEDPSRYTDSKSTYKEYLTQFVTSARSHKVFPVFLTSIERRNFKEGVFQETHGDYPNAMKDLAKELQVPCIDMASKTKELYSNLGENSSRDLFMVFKPNVCSNYPEGVLDNTHLRIEGAEEIAKIIAKETENIIKGVD